MENVAMIGLVVVPTREVSMIEIDGVDWFAT